MNFVGTWKTRKGYTATVIGNRAECRTPEITKYYDINSK